MSYQTSLDVGTEPAALGSADDSLHGPGSTPATQSDGGVTLNLANLSVEDEEAVDVNANPSGSYSIDAAKARPGKGGFSPSTKPYRPPFIIKGNHAADEDDVFQSPSKKAASEGRGSSERTPTGPKTKRTVMMANWRSGSSSGSDADVDSPSTAKVQRDLKRTPSHSTNLTTAGNGATFVIPGGVAPSMSPSNATPLITASNGAATADLANTAASTTSGNGALLTTPTNNQFAFSNGFGLSPNDSGPRFSAINSAVSQAVFPPSCCVFVANLLQSESEEALEAAVTQVFSSFGSVFVKIRRDAKQMPFAFCQFTNENDANRAIQYGRGRMIKGRPCRCERARANRLFFVERKYGPTATIEEVGNLLEGFGSITQLYLATHVERMALGLNEGVIVEFAMYDEGQAAFAAFRNHELYKMLSISNGASPGRSNPVGRAFLERYEVDRRSVFVGGLPTGTTEQDLQQVFDHYGSIERIEVRETPSRFEGHEKCCFAFIEYRSPVAVSRAVAGKNGYTFNGKQIKVAQKESDFANKFRRRSETYPASPPPSGQSVTPVTQSPASAPSVVTYGGTPYQQQYYSTQGTVFTDGNGQYYTAPFGGQYSPYYSSAPVSPTTAAVAQGQGWYGHYYGAYPYGPYVTQQQLSPPATGFQTASVGQVAPSITPTRSGHGQASTSTLQSQ